MRLTRRGWAALGLLACVYTAAWLAGDRALNAVAAPLLAALVVALALVWRADPPTITYDSFPAGFPGDDRALSVSVEGSGIVAVDQSLPAGLQADRIDAVVTPPYEFERTVTLAQRGVYRLAAPTVRQRDPLGLVSRGVDVETTCECVVYPPVATVADRHVAALFADDLAAERQEFDRLREYVPGDPLRNVHWKSSAKRDDFMVMEFAPTQRTETVTIAADAEPGFADAMATATATLAVAALDADLQVGLVIPDETLAAGQGAVHRGSLLRLLAGADAGTVPTTTHDEADISIRAGADGTYVRIGDRTEPFEALRQGTEVPA